MYKHLYLSSWVYYIYDGRMYDLNDYRNFILILFFLSLLQEDVYLYVCTRLVDYLNTLFFLFVYTIMDPLCLDQCVISNVLT